MPGAPCGPTSPFGPTEPAGPTGPGRPTEPAAPCEPAGPAGPGRPGAPIGPGSPGEPAGPVMPIGPGSPLVPAGPGGPSRFQLSGSISFGHRPGFGTSRLGATTMAPVSRLTHATITLPAAWAPIAPTSSRLTPVHAASTAVRHLPIQSRC